MKNVIWTVPQNKNEQTKQEEFKLKNFYKNKVIDVSEYKYISKKYGVLIVLGVFIILGLVSGSIFSQNISTETLQSLNILFLSDFSKRLESSTIIVFMSSLCAYFLFYFIQILMGFSAWGFIFMPLTTFIKGFGCGMCTGYLASEYGFTGIGFYTLIMLPSTVISLISMLIQGKESFNLSKNIFKLLIKNKENNTYHKKLNLSDFFMTSANMIILIALSAGLDVLTTLCFSSLFSF